jgi:hypothetical protein
MSVLRGQWYYDARLNPWCDTSEPKNDDWKAYEEIENEMIEDAYEKGEPEVLLDDYTIDLKRRFQYDYVDVKKQRLVMRIVSDKIDYKHRKKRFDIPELPVTKTFTSSGVWSSAFIEEWIRRNPQYLFKTDIIEQLSSGIIEEGRKRDKQCQAQFLMQDLKKMQRDIPNMTELEKFSVCLYTKASFVYELINQVLRDNDLSKVDTLGPVCCLLRNFLSKRNAHESDENNNSAIPEVVYRGTTLTPDMLQLYKESVGQVKSWLPFSSASKSRNVADIYGNTLFILEFATDTAPSYPGRNIESLSYFPLEEEVLLYPGVDFRIEKVVEATMDGEKNVIYLTLM